MFTIPNARKEYSCKIKRKNCPGNCDQKIYQSDTRKHLSGKYMVLNAENGRGGMRNDPHVCPDRVGSAFHKSVFNKIEYRWYMERLPCTHCGNKYNSFKLPLCPNCYKLECRKCGNKQTWIVKEDGSDGMACTQCGYQTDVIKVRPYVLI